MLKRVSESLQRALRRGGLDAALGTLGVALGLPSLLYPFGRDQGLYYYVAREWVQRGQIPYRDVFDHKTPGIYILHALSILVFGEKAWGIRVFDILGVVIFGLLVGSLYERAGRSVASGARGAGVLLVSMLFYGFLDFWNTAQSELWYAGLGVGSVWAARRIERLPRAAFFAGMLAGAALIMKPPAAPFLIVALGVLVARARRGHVRRRSCWRMSTYLAAGGILVPTLVIGYFAAHHALPDMRDIVVGANAYYVKHEPGAPPGYDWKDFAGTILTYYAPFTVLFPLGVAVAGWRARITKDSEATERVMLALTMLCAGVAAVMMQGKFYLVHWAACCVPFAYFGLVALGVFTRSRSPVRYFASALVVVGGYASTTWIPHGGAARWHVATMRAELGYLRGSVGVEEYNQVFQIPVLGFHYADSYRIGLWLRDHSAPNDLVSVRGFQPEIYAIAGRHQVGRFFWTLFLTSPYRSYKRAEWLAEDERDLRAHPPKYIVATTNTHEGPESVEWLATLGYRTVLVSGVFTIVER